MNNNDFFNGFDIGAEGDQDDLADVIKADFQNDADMSFMSLFDQLTNTPDQAPANGNLSNPGSPSGLLDGPGGVPGRLNSTGGMNGPSNVSLQIK